MHCETRNEAGMKAREPLPLSELLRLGGRPECVPADTVGDPIVSGLTHDSRAAGPGDLFVAIRGGVDGADFAAAAVAQGAAAVLAASPDRGLGVPWVQVADDRAALADCARALAGDPSRRLALTGITGTNGKTTTTWLLDSVLAAAGRKAGRVGTLGASWPGGSKPSPRTTPEAPELEEMLLAMEDAGCTQAVLEVSSHAIDLERVRGLSFAALGFTNLTQDHLDWHGDLETYFETKARLFTELAPKAPAAVGVDDAFGRRLAERLRGADPRRTVLTCGLDAAADLRVTDFEADVNGSRFRLRGAGRDLAVELRSPGRHDAQNAALAAALGLLLGLEPEAIGRGLADCAGVPGRLERVATGEGVSVFVDYAHAPAALEQVLEAVREITPGRLICVFGCGGDRDQGKRALMGEAVGRRADVAIATSDNPRSEDPLAILAMVREGLERTAAERVEEPDRREAIRRALETAREGDVVVVAGKGHETEQDVGGVKRPFDDRVVVRELWAELRG